MGRFGFRPLLGTLFVAGGLAYGVIGFSGCTSAVPTPQPMQETRPTASATVRPPPTKEPSPVLVPATEAAPTVAAQPTVVPTIEATMIPPTSTPIPLLGNDYQERIVGAGYSSEISQRIASLRYSETNRRFADGLLLIGGKAGYAQERLVELALPLLEDGKISDDELVRVTDIDNDGEDNETEIKNKTNVFDPFNKLELSKESFAVLDDELYAVVAGNGDLSYAFNLQNFKSMIKELKDAPYKDALLVRLDQLSEAWNYKIRREDEVLCVVIPKYQSGFDCNSAEARQFREDNGTYHLKLWLGGNSILPLDNGGLGEWFEKKDDAEFAVGQMWIPESMTWYDVSQWKIQLRPDTHPNHNFTSLRNNMDVILGKKKINGLTQFKDLRDRIVRVRDNRVINSYGTFGTDYEEGIFSLGRQTREIPQLRLKNVPEEYRTRVFSLLAKIKDFELSGLAYGLGVLDKGPRDLESSDTGINQIYQKALGYAAFEQLGRTPTDIGDHQYVAFSVPKQISQQFPLGVIIYRGQSVSPYSMEEGLREDRVRYVREPNGSRIVWTK